jgi:hypothetical protein
MESEVKRKWKGRKLPLKIVFLDEQNHENNQKVIRIECSCSLAVSLAI